MPNHKGSFSSRVYPEAVQLSPVALSTYRLFLAPTPSAGVEPRDYYSAGRDSQKIRDYYGDLPQNLKPERLFDRLNKLVTRTHNHEAAYNPSRYVYPSVDRRPDGELHCIYTYAQKLDRVVMGSPLDASKIGLGLAAEQAGEFTCEHAVCRVWFGDKQPMRGDMHILFACDKEVNEERGHARLGEVGPDGLEGKGGRFSRDLSVFEPYAGKGAVARATLYFLVRYPGAIHHYDRQDLDTLLKCHREDPVSDYERHRNYEIQARQGNRNPFIDFPEWAEVVRFRV